ncbi:MAG: hypothetical protein DRP64_05490 [Verrucomicrobia bacterium]|nr:MAG: hypothetical protein DRP64_05490 [Verrucomicrobiota bacterium]
MKKHVTMIAMAALVLAGMNEIAYGGETSLAGYLTYWDGGENGGNEGVGGGLKLRQKFLGFLSADIRASYVDFSDLNTSVIPVEATLMVGIPFFIEPYAGLGASYYFFDSDLPWIDDGAGVYGVLGLQLNLWVVGAVAELRWNEAEEPLMDGMSANLGLMVKW